MNNLTQLHFAFSRQFCSAIPTAIPTVNPTTPAPTALPTVNPTFPEEVSVIVESTLTFNNLDLEARDIDAFVAAFETSLAADLAPPPTLVQVIAINGIEVAAVPSGRARLLHTRWLQGTTDVVIAKFTQTAEADDDPAAVEEELRSNLAASLTLEEVNKGLDTEDMREFGDFKVNAISTDLDNGTTPIEETAVGSVRCLPFVSQTL